MSKIINSARYTVELNGHVFAAGKFVRAAQRLVSEGCVKSADIVEPQLPPREDLLLAHSAKWVDGLIDNNLSSEEIASAEMPVNPEIVYAHRLCCGGTIMACGFALKEGLGLHAGGGGHHAFRGHGEGFCLLNDIAVGIEKMRSAKAIRRAMVIDLDVHQGNGTAAIFADIPEVFTLSVHEGDIFPEKKEKSTLDVAVAAGTGDAEYLETLRKHLPAALSGHKPELVVYQAGVDVYEHDMLGKLKLTKSGLRLRDEFVFCEAFKRNIPVAVVLGGGYAQNPEDTVYLHAQTLRAAIECRRNC